MQWLEGGAGIVITNPPDRISVWQDQSGNSNHARINLGTPTDRPYWTTNAINGLPAVSFYGTNSFAFNLSSAITNWTEAEAFVVLRVAAAAPTNTRSLWLIGTNSTRYPEDSGQISDGFGRQSGFGNVGSTSQGLTNFHLYNVSTRQGEWVARLNGATKYATAANQVGFSATPQLGVGSTFKFAGDIAEILIYNRVLNGSERSSVNAYLNQKYRFVNSIPQPPTNIVADVLSSGQISLWWNAAINNEQTIYEVERSTDGSVYSSIAEVQGASLVDTGLAPNVLYYYRVRAKNLAGESGYSSTTNTTTLSSGTDIPFETQMFKLWLRADVGAPVNHDGTLNSWLDLSGNTNTVTYESTPIQRPFWAATINTNMHPMVRFFGSNFFGMHFVNSISNWSLGEAFLVLKAQPNLAPSGGGGHWRLGGALANGVYYPRLIDQAIVDTFGLDINNPGIINVLPMITNYHLYHVAISSNTWTAWVNANNVASRANSGPVTFHIAKPLLGEGQNPFGGEMAEFLLYNQNLSSAQRDTVNNYLRHKYNLW